MRSEVLGECLAQVFDEKQAFVTRLCEESGYAHADRLEQRAHLEKRPRPSEPTSERHVRRIRRHFHHDRGLSVAERRLGAPPVPRHANAMKSSGRRATCNRLELERRRRGGVGPNQLGEPAFDLGEPGRHRGLTVRYGDARAQARG